MSEELLPKSNEPLLSPQELDVLVKYTQRGLDNRFDATDFRNANNTIDRLSAETGDSESLGSIALIAATVGAMTRDPNTFNRSAVSLTKRMISEQGLKPEEARIFDSMQRAFMAKKEPVNVAEKLRSGLKYLKRRNEQHGEDTTHARVAFLASGFAATQDAGLRQAIFKQLKSEER